DRGIPPPWLVKLRGYRLVRKLDSRGSLPRIPRALSPTTHAHPSSVAGSNPSFLSAVTPPQSRISCEITRPTALRPLLNICTKYPSIVSIGERDLMSDGHTGHG